MDKTNALNILFICNSYGEHICRLISKTRSNLPNAVIDFMTIKRDSVVPDRIKDNIDHLYYFEESNSQIRLVSFIQSVYSRKKQIRQIGSERKYDCINIHCPSWNFSFLRNDLKSISRKLLITPWGSDVYRVKWYELLLLKLLYKTSDYVSGIDNRFLRDVKRIFSVPDRKIVSLNLGSDTVDYIKKNKEVITVSKAKEALGVAGHQIITCGYNGARAQNHLAIIKAIIDIKEQLPENIILFFPFTYAGTSEYVDELSVEMDKAGLKYKFFRNYLSIEDLFLLIQSTDLFVHVQTTDADCGSLKEYILCGKKAINGQWLVYDDLKRNEPLPYFPTASLNTLGKDILNAINSEPIHISPMTFSEIEKFGWDSCIKDWIVFFQRD